MALTVQGIAGSAVVLTPIREADGESVVRIVSYGRDEAGPARLTPSDAVTLGSALLSFARSHGAVV